MRDILSTALGKWGGCLCSWDCCISPHSCELEPEVKRGGNGVHSRWRAAIRRDADMFGRSSEKFDRVITEVVNWDSAHKDSACSTE